MKDRKRLTGAASFHAARSKDFGSFLFSDKYRYLSKETGIDFSTIIQFLDCMPIFSNGATHARQRSKMARALSSSSAQMDANLRLSLQTIHATLQDTNGPIDVVKTISYPLWRAVAEATLHGKASFMDEFYQLQRLFCPTTSLNTRRSMETLLRGLAQDYGAEVLEDVALATLGARPFVNAFAFSVHDLAVQNAGLLLSEIAYPKSLTGFAVPYVDRVAKTDVTLGGQTFEAGAHVKCVIVDPSYDAAQNAKNFFGIGPHICVGKRASVLGWSSLCQMFQTLDKVITPGALHSETVDPFEIVTRSEIVLQPCPG